MSQEREEPALPEIKQLFLSSGSAKGDSWGSEGPQGSGHSLSPSPFQVKPTFPNLSAMASGDEGDPPQVQGRRGSHRRRLSSGKGFWGAQGREQLQALIFLFILLLCSFGRMGFPAFRAFCKAGITDPNELN